MASIQTWSSSSYIRHPWFDTAVMKRKHRDTEPDDDHASNLVLPPTPASTPVASTSVSATTANSTTGRAPPAKRRRCSTLEHGLAHLSLGGRGGEARGGSNVVAVPTTYAYSKPINTYPRVQEVSAPQPVLATTVAGAATTANAVDANKMENGGRWSPMAVDLEMETELPPQQQQQRPHVYTVEEAEEEEGRAPEVKMGVVSWYEPEPDRIVITDLDSFTEEAEEEEAEAAREKLTINEALLARIRRQRAAAGSAASSPSLSSTSPSAVSNTNTNTSQALVLFRPLPLSDTEVDKVNNVQEQEKQRRRLAAEAERKRKEKEAEEKEQQRRLIETRDEDAMDVEP
ncbi:hypothetical protein BDN70DRAFT_928321 [Pholiota conissans]|uniref:Uncharacterized protein n=1 Tax=Pholiota conissans TaxID=109636 RepID=A0A9P5ZB59_9AGAR|nr:hypothetical protein BDN70DRAFT_928321 [Pholiota conissans]